MLDELLEKLYEEKDPDFMCLCASLSEEKGDRLLSRVLDDVYEKLISHPDPHFKPLPVYFRRCPGNLEGLSSEYKPKHYGTRVPELEKAFSDLSFEPDIYEKYRPAFEYCLAFAQSYLDKIPKRVGHRL